MGISSRSAVCIAALAAGLVCCGGVSAQDWPTRPVTMIVPYAPGGNIDQAARVFGRELSEKLGQQFIVESKGGAGGSLGAAEVAKSKPDGYTLLVTANGPSVLNKMLYASLPYDPDTDFTPISLISDVPQVFIVNPKSPVGDLKGLVALAKQKKDALTIGHPGVGTGAHLTAIWFANLAGINVIPVAYRGALPIVTAVLGGEIDAGMPAYIPQVHSAKIIAVTSERAGRFPARRADRARERRRRCGVGHLHRARRAGRHAAGDRHEDEPDPRRVPQDRRGEKAVRHARRPDPRRPARAPDRTHEPGKGALGSDRQKRGHQAAMIEKHIDIATADGRMDSFVVHPEEGGPFPGGPRADGHLGPARGAVRRGAARSPTVGYHVTVPNFWYRRGKVRFEYRDEKGRMRSLRRDARRRCRTRCTPT